MRQAGGQVDRISGSDAHSRMPTASHAQMAKLPLNTHGPPNDQKASHSVAENNLKFHAGVERCCFGIVT